MLYEPDDDEAPEQKVRAPGLRIPASPAVYLAEDSISAAVKEIRGIRLPWERTLGCWFFGNPQASTVLTEWPTDADGSALDFLCQIDLREVDDEVPGFDLTGLPRKVCLQIYVDLDAGPGPIDHLVVGLTRGQRKKHLMEPPQGSGVNDAWPILINPVGALTIPRSDSPELSLDPADERFYEAMCWAADEAAYDLNLFTKHPRNRPAATEPDYLPYVPMARMGGYIPAHPAEWQKPAQEALGCDASEMFLLYDGPVDPEPTPVGDPERLRVAILIERSRLRARDFTHTYAFSY